MKKGFVWLQLLVIIVFPAVSPAASGLPVPVLSSQDVKYYNGGVGIGERAAMPQLYPLKIVFATDRGLYLNNAEVAIASTGGEEVFRVRADNGPWLVVDVPAGSYTVKATIEGSTSKASTVTVKAGKKRIVILRWKTSKIDMGL